MYCSEKCGLQFFSAIQLHPPLGLLASWIFSSCMPESLHTSARDLAAGQFGNGKNKSLVSWGGGWCGAWPIKKSPKQKEEEATETFAWICFFGDFSLSTIVNHY